MQQTRCEFHGHVMFNFPIKCIGMWNLTYRRAELVHNIRNIVSGVEFKVPRPVWLATAQSAWKFVQLQFNRSGLAVVKEFPDQVLAYVFAT